jgi:hypothetical protein
MRAASVNFSHPKKSTEVRPGHPCAKATIGQVTPLLVILKVDRGEARTPLR